MPISIHENVYRALCTLDVAAVSKAQVYGSHFLAMPTLLRGVLFSLSRPHFPISKLRCLLESFDDDTCAHSSHKLSQTQEEQETRGNCYPQRSEDTHFLIPWHRRPSRTEHCNNSSRRIPTPQSRGTYTTIDMKTTWFTPTPVLPSSCLPILHGSIGQSKQSLLSLEDSRAGR